MALIHQCPHCHTIYRYGDVKNLMNRKSTICYHCKKEILISKKKFFILFLLIALFCAIFNVLELYMVGTVNFLVLFFTNVLFITAGLFLRPLFIKLKRADKNNSGKNVQNVKKLDFRDYNKKENKF